MSRRIQILNSKILAPRSSDAIIRRRLHDLLAGIPESRLTAVVAGAGYGKTTLIAGFAAERGLDAAWYRLEESDRDLATFLNYLVACIRKIHPDFGAETLKRMEEAQVLSQEREAVLAAFILETERVIRRDLIIVLDDYHMVRDNREINDALAFSLEHLPPEVHLVLTSRSELAFPISRLRARREVVDVTERDLAFTPDEIERLYSKLFGISLARSNFQALYRKTGGWASGLILFCHVARGKKPSEIETLLRGVNGSHAYIFNYLEENVHDLLPGDLRKFLVETSILPRLSPEFCDAFLGVENSRRILETLENGHLFTISLDEERNTWIYHQLFREFLQTKLKRGYTTDAKAELHGRAAALLEKEGDEEEALVHYLKAGRIKRARRLLSKAAKELIREGRARLIRSYLNAIPDDALRTEPWLRYLRAGSLELAGDFSEATHEYKKALDLFHQANDVKGIEHCALDLARHDSLSGDFRHAEGSLKDLLARPGVRPIIRLEALGHWVLYSSYYGEVDIADRCFDEAMALCMEIEDPTLRTSIRARLYYFKGWRWLYSGDFEKTLDMAERGKALMEAVSNQRMIAVGCQLISAAHYYLGRFEEGRASAGQGLKIIREKGYRDVTLPWQLILSARNRLELGEIEAARGQAEEGLKSFREIGNPQGLAYAWLALHIVYLKIGESHAAEEALRTGIDVVKELDLPLIQGGLKGSLARFMIDRGRFGEALPLLEESEKKVRHSKFDHAWMLRVWAMHHLRLGQMEPARDKLSRALRICLDNRYDRWVVAEKRWIVPLLAALWRRGEMRAYIEKICREMGPDAENRLFSPIRLEAPGPRNPAAASGAMTSGGAAPGLKVRLLGKFSVNMGPGKTPVGRWKSRKAKTLFKYLAAFRERGYIPKEILMELLWPEEDHRLTANRFHVARASLRKTLEPHIPRRTPSSYILSRGDAYRIDLGKNGWLDIDYFTSELNLAKAEERSEASMAHYLNAASVYRGPFLEEDPYEEWCAAKREMLEADYLRALANLIEAHAADKDHDACIEYAGKYLAIDKYAENIHRKLMRFYYAMGKNAMVIKTFQRCKENIVNDLKCPLSDQTEGLYGELVDMQEGRNSK